MPPPSRHASFALAALCAVTAGGQEARDWERVLPGIELAYPRDHGAHPATRIEWWYVTGQLAAEGGRRFGFQLTVFQSGMGARPTERPASPLRAHHVLAGHLALTDVEDRATRFAERLRRSGSPLAYASTSDLDVVLEDWSLARAPDDRLTLAAGDTAAGFELDLELAPTKPLVLHGAGGYSFKGSTGAEDDAGNASAYVSWTRLATRGRVVLDGESLEVRGASWFDHEFGSSVLPDGVEGWDWFGLQLDDGRELMLFVLREGDGEKARASAGTLVEPDGRARALTADDWRLERHASWTSPRTGATYPARWTLAVPSAAVELDVVPLVADCEFATHGSTDVVYWEGPVVLRDPRSGDEEGRGYAELTGYAGSMTGRF